MLAEPSENSKKYKTNTFVYSSLFLYSCKIQRTIQKQGILCFKSTVKRVFFLYCSMKILILCTGNSCRSQMAHGFLQSFNTSLIVRSAGTEASGRLNMQAVKAMQEIGIDISHHTSDSVTKYLDEEWDYVITVCGGANESCPTFSGKVKNRLHIGFDDPSFATGSEDFIWGEYIRVREEIRKAFYDLYIKEMAT